MKTFIITQFAVHDFERTSTNRRILKDSNITPFRPLSKCIDLSNPPIVAENMQSIIQLFATKYPGVSPNPQDWIYYFISDLAHLRYDQFFMEEPKTLMPNPYIPVQPQYKVWDTPNPKHTKMWVVEYELHVHHKDRSPILLEEFKQEGIPEYNP